MAKNQSALKNSRPEKRQPSVSDIYKRAVKKFQMAHRWRAADGRSAFAALSQAAYGDKSGRDPRKLGIEDATIIASRLHIFLQEVAPRLKELGVSRGELCRRAGLTGRTIKQSTDTLPEDAKELYRLTLPPGADASKRGIRVGALKYLNLIEVLTSVLGDSVELIADRLLRGTSLHAMSKSAGEWSDLDLIQAHLQRIVNDIDRDFDLLRTYRRTAELKCKWIDEGGDLGWPLGHIGNKNFSNFTDKYSAEDIEVYRLERIAATDPSQAFYRRHPHFGSRYHSWWLFGFETGALQDDDLFHVPHAALGHLLMWDLPERRKDKVAYELKVKIQIHEVRRRPETLALPDDDWDHVKACPVGQTGQRTGNWRLQDFFWLLAYPHPDGKSLVPTLYCAGEEGGAYMLPLDMEALDMLSDAVWVSADEQCSVVDRLAALLTDAGEDGFNPMERNLRRTASWLLDNPILKRQREREDRRGRLDEAFRTESRPAARTSANK